MPKAEELQSHFVFIAFTNPRMLEGMVEAAGAQGRLSGCPQLVLHFQPCQ